MFFPAAFVALVVCIVAAYRCDGRRSPVVLALSVWGVSLLLALPIVFSYAVAYSVWSDLFVAACLSALTLSYCFLRQTRPPASAYDKRAQEIRIAKRIGVVGILGCLLLLYDAYLNAGLQFSPGYLINNLTAIRTENADRLAEGVSPGGTLVTIASLMAPCGILTAIAAVRLGREGGSVLRQIAAANFALLAAVSLLVYAGRSTLVNVGLLILISLFLSGRRWSLLQPRTIAVAALVLGTLWYFSTGWLGTREENANATAILEETQRAEPQDWLKTTVANDAALGLATVSLGYFASPIPTLAFYMQQPHPGPFYGAYSFPIPDRAVGTITGTWTPSDWLDTRRAIYEPLEARNYFGNVWATWLRDLLVDFGYLGAIIFCMLFGSFMAWARNQHEHYGALHYHYFEVIACFTLGFGAFTSVLWSSFIAVPFFLALGIMAFVRADWAMSRSVQSQTWRS